MRKMEVIILTNNMPGKTLQAISGHVKNTIDGFYSINEAVFRQDSCFLDEDALGKHCTINNLDNY